MEKDIQLNLLKKEEAEQQKMAINYQIELQNSCDEDMPMRGVYNSKEIHNLCKENPNRPPKKILLPYDTDTGEFNMPHYEL